MNKAQKLEAKRMQEYQECLRQEENRKQESLDRNLKKLDRVFKFLDLTDDDILIAISEKIGPEVLSKILKFWSEGDLKEEKKAKEFKTEISHQFSSDECFKLYENLNWYDQEDFRERFVNELEQKDKLIFVADTLEKTIAFEQFKEEWKNK